MYVYIQKNRLTGFGFDNPNCLFTDRTKNVYTFYKRVQILQFFEYLDIG